MSQFTSPGYVLRKPKTIPSFRVAASGKADGMTSVSVTIPGTAQPGDFALAFHVLQEGRTGTPPVGWTALSKSTDDRPSTTNAPAIFVSYKILVAGDIGSAKSWTNSSSSDSAVVVSVYSGVGGISVLPVWNINDATSAGGFAHISPEIKSGPYDRIVTAVGAYTVLALGLANGQPSSPPSGFTQRGSNGGGNFLVKPRTITVADSGINDTPNKTWSFSNAVYTGMVSLALRPSGDPSLADVEVGPTSLNGKPVYAYGASYHNFVLGTGVGVGNTEHITDSIQHRRIMNALGRNSSSKNLSLGGSHTVDQCSLAFGTDTEKTEFGPDDAVHVNTRATTWLSQTQDSLVLWDGLGNDALVYFNDPLRIWGAWNALNSLVRLFLSGAYVRADNAAFSYSAGWSSSASNGFMGGLAMGTATPGATCTYSATVPHDLVLIGYDDAAIGLVGSPFTITVDGVQVPTLLQPVGSLTTSNQMKASGQRRNYKYIQMTIPIESVNPSGSTIVITKGSGSGSLQVSGTLIRSSTPPVIVLSKLPTLNWAQISATYGGIFDARQAAFDAFNVIPDEVKSQIADPIGKSRIMVYDPMASGKFDYSTMVGFDYVHINGAGHAHYASEILRGLNERFV